MRGVACSLLIVLTGGCQEPVPSPAPARSSASATAVPSRSVEPGPAAPPSAVPPPAPSGRAAPTGGNWLKCYANFQPRTKPELDVMRLGLMCGPSNGMRKAVEAKDTELGEGVKEREHAFVAEPGDCYRVFAVGDSGIEDLDVEVLGPSGTRVAFDTSDDRWPVVKPDGPFCVFEGGTYKARVHAQRGAGHYAIEVWRLR